MGIFYAAHVGGVEHIVDSYSELHGTQIIEWDSGSPPLDGVSQSFTGDGSVLTSCVFSIYQLESFLHATKGSFYATLNTHLGVFGASSIPGAQLATSAMLDVRANVPDDTTVQVRFPFITPYQSVNGTKYTIVFNYSFPIPDGQGHLGVWYDPSSLATFPGNMAKDVRTWIPNSDADLCFYVNGIWI